LLLLLLLQVEYDTWDGVVPHELRIGLDAIVLIELPHEPLKVSEDVLIKLQRLLQLEVQGLSSALEQKPPSKQGKLEAQAKREYLLSVFVVFSTAGIVKLTCFVGCAVNCCS
jgi:adenine C2-methylase RlmN of 23S rRNA A2503 and tRNA A37